MLRASAETTPPKVGARPCHDDGERAEGGTVSQEAERPSTTEKDQAMIVCVPVGGGGAVDPRWGRAARVALATVEGHAIVGWEEHDVGWDSLHDAGSEAGHHARVARFLRDHEVEIVVADHMGGGMRRMLDTMHVTVHLGAAGDARSAVLSVVPA